MCVVGKKPGERQCMEDEEIKDELCEQEGEKERERAVAVTKLLPRGRE